MHTSMRWRVVPALAVAPLVSLATPASAHHMMGGKLPGTVMEGLLSGIGHPLIGPDHLAFIVAVGIAAALLGAGRALIATFVGATLVGVLVHQFGVGVPLSEELVAASVILAGFLIAAWNVRQSAVCWIGLALVAGLLHGYAFGESIAGAGPVVLGAYLAGIAVITAAVCAGAMLMARALLESSPSRIEARLVISGLGVISVGLMMLMLNLAT